MNINKNLLTMYFNIYVYWCPTSFLYHMRFVSLNSHTTDITSRSGTVHPSQVPEFILGFMSVCISQWLVSCVVYCRSLLVILFVILWPLFCLFFYFLRLFITSLLSSNFSCTYNYILTNNCQELHINRLNFKIKR